MRRVRMLLAGLCLLGSVVGCKTIQHTAGVCDCNPPPVEELLKLPANTFCHGHFTPSPTAGPVPPMTYSTPAPPVMQPAPPGMLPSGPERIPAPNK